MKQVTQLRHDLNAKIGLLQIYSQDLESDEDHDRQEEEDAGGGGKSQTAKRNSSSGLPDWQVLKQKVASLERDNRELREEASSRETDLDKEEKKEMQLISDCVKQMSEFTV